MVRVGERPSTWRAVPGFVVGGPSGEGRGEAADVGALMARVTLDHLVLLIQGQGRGRGRGRGWSSSSPWDVDVDVDIGIARVLSIIISVPMIRKGAFGILFVARGGFGHRIVGSLVMKIIGLGLG